jgi:trehalose/maltose transport system substrate-binding protein
LPAGVDRHSSVLGGWCLGVSKYTRHLSEAIAFVKYLAGRDAQMKRAISGGFLPTFPSLYRDPAVLRANPFFSVIADVPNRVVRRPAALAGGKYESVSQAYSHGVHRILTREVSASEGASEIQTDLVHLTGYPHNERVLSRGGNQERR